MQGELKAIEAAGLRVVGISYDSPAVLKKFAEKASIGFPLLSDPESETIKAYQILNDSGKGKAEGVPYPGTFVLDGKGVIRAKLFVDGYRQRHTPAALIEAAKAID